LVLEFGDSHKIHLDVRFFWDSWIFWDITRKCGTDKEQYNLLISNFFTANRFDYSDF